MSDFTHEEKVLSILGSYVRCIQAKDGVEGIIILGGFGKRMCADNLSDVDVAIFVDGTTPSNLEWLPNFEFDVFPKNNSEIIHFNVHQQNIDHAAFSVWDDMKREAYANGKVVYDKGSRIAALLKTKLEISDKEYQERLIRQYVKIPPSCLINPRKQLRRGYPILAQQILNNALEILIDSLFVINRKFVPHYKWKLLNLSELAYLPGDFIQKVNDALILISHTQQDVERRAKIVEELGAGIMGHIESIMNMSEMEIYNLACYKYLDRQLNEIPFASVVRNYIRSNNLDFKDDEIDKITGFINYLLIDSFSCLEKSVNNIDDAILIKGLDEVKKLLATKK